MRHLYVHVPFCVRRCVYCDFSIAVRKSIPVRRYVEAVLWEHAFRLQGDVFDEEAVETLYFGGGTPSLLPETAIAALSAELLRGGTARDPEITIEANPDDVTERRADGWVAAGVTRVSLGAQSFHAHALEWMHRTHDATDTMDAVRTLRRAGIASVSLDLIFGLPPSLAVDFARDLECATACEPDHLSVYGLTVEPRTPLARWVSRGTTNLGSDDRYEEEFLLAHDYLVAAGYEHYEVSNYCRAGHAARHNSAYWSGQPYGGLGPSAHSYRSGLRQWNVAPWSAYEECFGERRDPTSQRETLSDEQLALERAYLGLRTASGLPPEAATRLNGATVTEAVAQGWLSLGAEGARLTPTGWLRLDELVVALTTSAGGG